VIAPDRQKEVTVSDSKHRGSTLGAFEEETVPPKFQAKAVRAVSAWQLMQAMRNRNAPTTPGASASARNLKANPSTRTRCFRASAKTR
jgi:hypothetical protein